MLAGLRRITHVFKTCVQTFVTTSFEVIVIVSFLCIGDQSSFVRSFISFCSLAAARLWLKIPVNVK